MLSQVLYRELTSADTVLDIPPEFTMRVATRNDLVQAQPDWPKGALETEFIDAALARGDLCIAAFAGEKLLAMVWRSFSVAPHSDLVDIHVEKPYWYTYKMMTLPQARGTGLGGLLTVVCDRLCQDSGCVGGVGFVETHNYSSLRANAKVGAKRVGYAGIVQVCGKAYPFRTSGVRPFTFQFVARTRMQKS